jgi:hypothetical protein
MSQSTASLSNMSVPLMDLGVSSTGQGLIFPKLKFRFRLLFIGFGVATNTLELTKQIIDVKKPTVTFDENTIDVYNSKIKYAGKPTWSGTSVTIRDSMDGAVQSLVAQQIQRQFDFMNMASSTAPSNYKFEMLIEEIDGGNGAEAPTILSTWDLAGCWIKSADYDSLDYKSSDPVTIKLDIEFDNALQSATGIGTAVPWLQGISSI